MFVELVYDKRNVEDLPSAKIILAELTKRVHKIFPGADVRVKPMQANALNSDCTKTEKSAACEECLKRLICGWLLINYIYIAGHSSSPARLTKYVTRPTTITSSRDSCITLSSNFPL
jgi:hypothetical protein